MGKDQLMSETEKEPTPPEEPDTFDDLPVDTDVEPDYEAEEQPEEGNPS
jgi:hypothetical protein